MMNTVKAIDVQCERCSLVDGCFSLTCIGVLHGIDCTSQG